jgi:4-amino-4-deoxy-L-arabinose transferase-like glycosyltransferase
MRTNRAGIWVLLGAFLLLGAAYGLATPVLEASDELHHFPVVAYLAGGKGLPVQDPAEPGLWLQEGSQPPLYYLLSAALTRSLDLSDLEDLHRVNPHANVGDPLAPGNKNMLVRHRPAPFPWHGTVLAVHLLRFLSVLLQSVTVYMTYRIGLLVMPGRTGPALLAGAIVAFNPMFLFISTSVNNDNLIAPLCSVALFLLAAGLRARAMSWPGVLALGFVLAAAAITKLSGLAMLPLAAAVLAWISWERRDWRRLAGWYLVIGAFVLAAAGWWYARNLALYNDPTGLNVMLEIAGGRPAPLTAERLLGELQGLWLSYWGVFGGFNILGPRPLYWIYGGVVMMALAGWLLRAAGRARALDRSGRLILVMLAAWFGLEVVALVRWTSLTMASQGRLLFPAAAAVAVLLAIGIYGWQRAAVPDRAPARAGVLVPAAVAGVLFAGALFVPVFVLRPAYAVSPILEISDVPVTAQRIDTVYAGALRLLAVELPEEPVRPGERTKITAWWESMGPTERDLSVFVHLLGRGGKLAGVLDTYPGLGTRPTSSMLPGQVVRDEYAVRVPLESQAPSLLRVDIGLFEPGRHGGKGLPAVGGDGKHRETYVGWVRLLEPQGAPEATPEVSANYTFGGSVELLGTTTLPGEAEPGREIPITLYWRPKTPLEEPYQVFLHLVDASGKLWAQADGAPLGGDWPTDAWEPGRVVVDSHTLTLPSDLPAGSYELRTGLYRLADLTRLAPESSRDPVRDQAAILHTFRVAP